MTTKLFLTGIGCEGRHGVNPGEKDAPQPFVVDLDLDVEAAGDDIGDTADYREIARRVRETVGQESFDLLESLAHAVAGAVASMPRVVRVTAVVHKPNAARSLGIEGVAAAASAGAD
ncbi:MAG: dihydroneopterin aldolase [Actinobacteria bacterium]|nr:dihydroneopterin aldolase [Actinomycetota bacterium]